MGKKIKIHHILYEINRTKSLTYIVYIIDNGLHLKCLMSDISIFFVLFWTLTRWPLKKETQDQSMLLYLYEVSESAMHINI